MIIPRVDRRVITNAALTNQISTVVAYTNSERTVQGFYFARAEGFDT
jgi:hypothetical protein